MKNSMALSSLENGQIRNQTQKEIVAAIPGTVTPRPELVRRPAANQAKELLQPLKSETEIFNRKVLNTWKEIATYMGRGVRTVQRWEAELSLPAHRPRGKNRSAVLAFTDELDDWLRRTPTDSSENQVNHSPFSTEPMPSLLELAQKMQALAERMVVSSNSRQREEAASIAAEARSLLQKLAILETEGMTRHI